MSAVNDNRGGPRIRAAEWQVPAGIGGTPPDPGICKCGRPYHEHEKKRVNHEDGGYSYDYQCPEGST